MAFGNKNLNTSVQESHDTYQTIPMFAAVGCSGPCTVQPEMVDREAFRDGRPPDFRSKDKDLCSAISPLVLHTVADPG